MFFSYIATILKRLKDGQQLSNDLAQNIRYDLFTGILSY